MKIYSLPIAFTIGLFNTVEDLLNVKGIGQKIFEGIKDFVEV